MTYLRKISLILLACFLPFVRGVTAFGSQITIKSQVVTNNCYYFSSIDGIFDVTYTNSEIPQSAKVNFVYGLGLEADDNKAHWNAPGNVDLVFGAESEQRSNWSGRIWRQLAGRGGPAYHSLQFVIHVEYESESGRVSFWEKGNTSHLGYYSTDQLNLANIECLRSGDEPEHLEKLDFYSVVKWFD